MKGCEHMAETDWEKKELEVSKEMHGWKMGVRKQLERQEALVSKLVYGF